MHTIVDENIPGAGVLFKQFGTVTLLPGRNIKPVHVKKADALIIRSITRVDSALLKGSNIRFVGTATIGTDHIDQNYLTQNNIKFAHAPGCNSNSVGDYMIAALLHLQKYQKLRLAGKTLGIIGCGNVGCNLVKKAEALGLRILKNDPPLARMAGSSNHYVHLNTICSESDLISIHVPLTYDGDCPTHLMINNSFFKRLVKPIAFFNTCRGKVMDGSAVIRAKKSGRLSHLVLDVFPDEPHINPELVSCCEIATPHIAGYSFQGKTNGLAQIFEAFCNYFKLTPIQKALKPVPAHPIIEKALKFKLVTPLNEILKHNVDYAYDIMQDHRALIESLKKPNPGAEFDKLRKVYPGRHEFSAYQIRTSDIPSQKLEDQFCKLGFQII